MTEADNTVDVRGMTCPMPLIEIHKAMLSLNTGQRLCIIGDDPIFEVSIEDYCNEHDYEIVDVKRENRVVSMTIYKTAGR